MSDAVLWGLAALAAVLAFVAGWLAVECRTLRAEAGQLRILLAGEQDAVRLWQTCAEARKAQLFKFAPRLPQRTVQLPSLAEVDPEEFKRTQIRRLPGR